MERLDRPIVATFVVPSSAGASSLALPDDAAHHARVKRLAVGDAVRLTDGAGQIGLSTLTEVTKQRVVAAVEHWSSVPPLPALHLFVPVADRDRMLMLAEKCAELDVTSWHPVYFARSRSVNPRGEGDAFQAKVRARMVAALEQSGGAWLPEVRPPVELSDVLGFPAVRRILFDAGGDPVLNLTMDAPVAAMVGPEGGYTEQERFALLAAGWTTARLEGNMLRFESAGIAAAAVLRAMLARGSTA